MNARTRRRFRAANANLRKLRGPGQFKPNEQLRLFVAIEMPDEWKQSLGRFMERIRSSTSREPLTRDLRIRWIKPEELHLTLKFLGEVTPDRLNPINEALQQAVDRAPRVALAGTEVGSFIDRQSPHAVWLSITEPESETGNLQKLVDEIEDAMEASGFARESRAFLPHLTLARLPLNMASPAREKLAEIAHIVQPPGLRPFRAELVSLLRSHQGAEGAWYERLKAYPDSPLQGGWQPI